MSYSSKLIERAVEAFSTLPSIGKKSAFRLVIHLIQQDKESVEQFLYAIKNLKDNIKKCERCYNLSDDAVCSICSTTSRDSSIICVVESVRDVIAIEETNQFNGLYHVLGGVISPLEGVGVSDLTIAELLQRCSNGSVKELIMGISPTIEGDTTIFYISKQLKDLPIKISTLSRGVAFGGELEYTDELTLGRSILARVDYQQSV